MPEPIYLLADQGNSLEFKGPDWDRWDVGGNLTAWKSSEKRPWNMYYIGMSRSGPFYHVMAAATPLPRIPRLAVAAYPIFQGGEVRPCYYDYVYIERRDYPEYANAEQYAKHLLSMPERCLYRAEVAEELAKLARTDPSSKPMLRKLAIPFLEKARKRDLSGSRYQAAIRDAISAIESDVQPATQPAVSATRPTRP